MTNAQRRNSLLVGIGIVILLVSVVGNVALGYWYHQSSASSQRELAQKDQQILALQRQTKEKATEAALALEEVQALNHDISVICQAAQVVTGLPDCATFPNFAVLTPSVPSAPAAAPTASAPRPRVTPTTAAPTTTALQHGKSHKH